MSTLWRNVARMLQSRHRSLALVLAIFLAAGCTTAEVQFARKTQTIIEPHHSVLILATTESPLEIDAEECISESVRAAIPDVRILNRDEFHRRVFYYGYPEREDESVQYFTSLVRHPVTKKRIAELALRYAVLVHGGTEQQGEPILGAIGGGGGAVTWFGAHWTRRSHLEAWIFDFKEVTEAGTIRFLAEGKPWIICIGLGPLCAPIGAAAFTETKACSGLGSAVATFLAGGSPPNSASSTGQARSDRDPSE